ncbi:MAG: AMP-binding protein [Clostridia bacterium]|nr:AMP-binding protein [Clostridia bacterium]
MKQTLLTVRDIVNFAAEKYSDNDFCKYFRDDKICVKSFKEFREDCLAVSRYVKSIQSEKMHIAFIGNTNYEYVACLTGMICSGNVVVPFAPDISVEEACKLFDDADIEMLFCEESFIDRAKEIQNNYKRIRQVVSLGDWHWFKNIFDTYSSDSEYAHLSDVEINPDDCALIIYTSGTTGERKGVMLSNKNLASNSCYDTYISNPGETSLSILPMHHVFCYACDVLKVLYDGITVCLNGPLVNLYKNLLAFQPTSTRIVPLLCKSILTKIKIAERKNSDLSPRDAAELVVGKNFTKMLAGSAFLSGALIDELAKYGIIARQGYGMSECSPRITTADFSEDNKYSNGVLTGVDDVRVLDGEIQVKGPSVMLGYYKKPERTAEAFTEDGYLHTGDLGYIKNGHIYLVGRKKNLIILSNGENVSPEEIENKFADDGIIKEIVCYGEKDRIVAEIFPDYQLVEAWKIENVHEEIETIVNRVNSILNTDRQISVFKIRETPFERTTTGKIKRAQFNFAEDEAK